MRSAFQSGFTLLELLIVIAVLSLMIVFVMPNIRNIKDEQALNSVVLELQSNIRFAQNNALSGTKCASSNESASEWRFTVIDNSSYQIEASCVSGSSPTKSYSFKSQNVVIESINGCTDPALASVSYSNITGSVTMTPPPSCATTADMRIILKVSNNNGVSPKTLVLDQGGRIYVQ